MSILCKAVASKNLTMVESQLKSGADPNRLDQEGFAPLHRACIMNTGGIVDALLAGGARVGLPDSAGDTALHYAATCSTLSIVQALLAAGADPTCKGADDETPLGCADARGDDSILLVLQRAVKSRHGPAYLDQLMGKIRAGQMRRGTVSARDSSSGAYQAFSSAQQGAGPGPVPGHDLATGIVHAGSLQVKTPGTTFKWRVKYFVLSQKYEALFYWTGTATTATSTAQMVRASTFRRLTHFVSKKAARRFALTVTSGKTLHLLASSMEVAGAWLAALDDMGKEHIAATTIASAWRGHCGRRVASARAEARQGAVAGLLQASAAASERAQAKSAAAASGAGGGARQRAQSVVRPPRAARSKRGSMVTAVSGSTGMELGDGASLTADENGVVVEGPLKKHAQQTGTDAGSASKAKASTESFLAGGSLSVLSFRLRYFVLNLKQGELQYFVNLHERLSGVQPTTRSRIPVQHLHSVRCTQGSKRFVLMTTRGAMLQCEAPDVESAAKWTSALQAVVSAFRGSAGQSLPPVSEDSGEVALAEVAEEGWGDEEYAADSDEEGGEVEWVDEDAAPIVDAWGRHWTSRCDEEGDEWYVNEYTGASEWERPENAVGTAEYPWTADVDDEGDVFYVNSAAAWAAAQAAEGCLDADSAHCAEGVPESTWETPPGWEWHEPLLRQRAEQAAHEGRYEWDATLDEEGDAFYTNVLTGEMQWEQPPGWAAHMAYVESTGESGLVEPEVEGGYEEAEDEEV